MVADVEMACNRFRDSRVYRPRGMLIQFHRVLLLSAGGLHSLGWASLYRLRGTLKQPLLEDVRPLAHCAGDVRSVVARPHAAVVSPLPTVQCRGLYSLERASLYRLGRALTHPLLKRVKPLPPSARVVRNDPTDAHAAVIRGRGPEPPPMIAVCIDSAGRSFRLTSCHCLSTRGLYPHPWASSV